MIELTLFPNSRGNVVVVVSLADEQPCFQLLRLRKHGNDPRQHLAEQKLWNLETEIKSMKIRSTRMLTKNY
jgi:hypothetical protein